MSDNACYERATTLRRNGYEPLPIKPGTKHPAVNGWLRGGIDNDAWPPDCGIGVLCGHGDLVALDIDTDDLAVNKAVNGLLPPDCPRKRGRKGVTIFVRAKLPKKIKQAVGFAIIDGEWTVSNVEALTVGQQTVIPPSLHPSTKQPYEWVAGNDDVVRTLYEMPLADLPGFEGDLEEALQRALAPLVVPTELIKACNAIAAAANGERNDTFNREVFKLASGEADIREDVAKRWLIEAACHAGLDDDEISATFKSAANGGSKQHNSGKQEPSDAWREHRTLASYPERQINFTWWPYIPQGMITILGGRGNQGKGLIATDFAARTTIGGSWPESTERATKGRVLWFEAEDDIDAVLRPRLASAGADLELIEPYLPSDMPSFDAIKSYIANVDVAMLVFSPLNSFLRCLKDITSDTEVRKALEELQGAIRSKGCAALGITHLNKKADLETLDRLLGSVAFANVARSVLMVNAEEGDEDSPEQRRLVHAKWNASVQGADLLYEVEHTDATNPRSQRLKLKWSRPLQQADPVNLYRPKAGRKRQSASAWLFEYLVGRGPTRKAVVIEAGEMAGFKAATLEQAHSRNPIFTSRIEGFRGQAIWSLETG